jgi:hypothetical protein
MKRAALGILAALGLIVAALGAPVAYVETMCQGSATPTAATPLTNRTRPATNTLLTYPEWHIVHAYDDYARVITTDAPHDFGYGRAIAGYWSSLCALTRASSELGPIAPATKQMVYVIGVSFSAELAMKALYEETLGRLTVALRGSQMSPLDHLSAEQAAAYAQFLQQVPWYKYDFRADAQALSQASSGSLRDRERALALGLEHRARAAYAGVIAQAVAEMGGDELTLEMVVTDLAPDSLTDDGVRVVGALPEGVVLETPRYRALTHRLAQWAAQGASFVQIAGNDRILFTALSATPTARDALASLPRQGYGDTRHLFLVPVADLADTLRALPARGLVLEHVHDY